MTMLGFLQGEEKDNKGRYLFDYWEADNQWLEETYDYIQWMFQWRKPGKENAIQLLRQGKEHMVNDSN